jgi:glycosyltransferase involved in cell wall biosynthesis
MAGLALPIANDSESSLPMNIVHLTPGAGGMYCGGCFRDNALVRALRQLGHNTLMVPLYLPLNLEESDQSDGTPIFFSGINVYLEQKSALFRQMPLWLNRILAWPTLLRWGGRLAAKTRPSDVGQLTLSMLAGEAGNQARELAELIAWLKSQGSPDVVCLSNALLVGMARQLKAELKAPVVCTFQGEDGFLDALPAAQRGPAWQILSERAREVDLFLAPSRFFGEVMQSRLELAAERVRVVHNGISLAGFGPSPTAPNPPALGFFARMCREKGLDLVVEAFLILRARNRVPNLRLRAGGSLGPPDGPFVQGLQERLRQHGVLHEVEFCPNLDQAAKQAFYRSLSVLSVPARYQEAFGLYVIEALASGVPVVQPNSAAFPELVKATGGGVLFEPENAQALADAVEPLLLNSNQARALGLAGRRAVEQNFSIELMAHEVAEIYQQLRRNIPCCPSTINH